MSAVACSIRGVPVTVRLAMKMEDSLQAFAVRAACFIGGLGVPFAEEFDGHDDGATHVIVSWGDEPIGAVRVRWFGSVAKIERLSVLRPFRGHRVGEVLLERCRSLAEGRGCNTLYAHVLPSDLAYWSKQGWQRLESERHDRIVALLKPVNEPGPRRVGGPPEMMVLRDEQQLGSRAISRSKGGI